MFTSRRPPPARSTDILALRNLLHDRIRFIVTLVGIVFSVVLSSVQLGLFPGFTRATGDVIDRSDADRWVLSTGVTHLETGVPFSDTLATLARGVDGVARATVADTRRLRVIGPTMMRLAGLFAPAARESVERLCQFTEPFVVSSAAIEQTLGLQPTPIADGWSRTLAWYKGNGV